MAEVDKPLGDTQLLEDPRRALVNRVAASESFNKSPRLRKLLIYLAECALQDAQSSLTEQQVGVAVFNRIAGYDTSADTVVRVQASEIRKRLKYYFLSEGLHEPLTMELPRGSYLPTFNTREPLENLPADDASSLNGRIKTPDVETPHERFLQLEEASTHRVPVRPHSPRLLLSLLGVSVILCGWLAYQNARLRSGPAEATPYLKHFWVQFFLNGQQTEVVPGDIGLIVLADVLGRNISLKEYSSADYPKTLLDPLITDPKRNYYVTKAMTRGVVAPYDASVLHDLSRFSERYQMPFQVVATREARVDSDLTGNLILLGHNRTNPWVELFESRMNFKHRFDDPTRTGMIVNTAPLPDERPSYVLENRQSSYAVAACLPGSGDKGTVLVLFGGNLTSIDGAAQLVTDEATMAKLHARLGIRLSDRMPYFEALLEKAPNAQKFEIIAHRIIKN